MKKIIVAGKGGAGKTTILSVVLVELLRSNPGKRVLVVDADPSSNLIQSLGIAKPEIEPIGELSSYMPDDWSEYKEEFFQNFRSKSLAQLSIENESIDYGYLGHHVNNSCLCAYNNALNYLLKHLEESEEYDYIFLDREAGVEHINRSVYGGKSDKLVVVSWPTSEYLAVAKDIIDLADMLGTTSERLLVVNNNQGLSFTEDDLESSLKDLGLQSTNHVVVPKMTTFKGLTKLSAQEILKSLESTQISVIDSIVEFIVKDGD